MTSAEFEALALDAHREANLPLWFPTAGELAEALGIVVLPIPADLRDCGALVFPKDQAIAIEADTLDAFWAVARVYLHRRGHRDVGREAENHLALALAIPADRGDQVPLFAQHLPAADVARRHAQLQEAPDDAR